MVFRNISNEFNPFHIQDYHLLWFCFPADSVREDEFLTHVGSRPKTYPTTPYSAPYSVRSFVEALPFDKNLFEALCEAKSEVGFGLPPFSLAAT